MNCKIVSQRLDSYLDGELPGTEMLVLRRHLNDCCACAEEAESLRSLKSALGALSACSVPDDLEDRLMSAIAGEHSWVPSGRRMGLAWGSALTLAAAAGFVFVWFGVVRARSAEQPMASSGQPSFEVSRDQVYDAASDPLSGHSMVVTASYGGK